jgi:hypothetical protein
MDVFWSKYFLYRYYRYHSKILSVIIHVTGAAIEPLALLLSAVFQTLLSVRHQNGQYCQKISKICCKSVTQGRPYMDTDRNENQTNIIHLPTL